MTKRTCIESCMCLRLAWYSVCHSDTHTPLPFSHQSASPVLHHGSMREDLLWRCPALRGALTNPITTSNKATTPEKEVGFPWFFSHPFTSNYDSTLYFMKQQVQITYAPSLLPPGCSLMRFVIWIMDNSYTPLPTDACAHTLESSTQGKSHEVAVHELDIFCLSYTVFVNILNQHF